MKKSIYYFALAVGVSFTLQSCKKATTWYQDADGDGKGNSKVSMESVEKPTGYVSDSSDDNDLVVTAKQRTVFGYYGAVWCPPCGSYGSPTKDYIDSELDSDDVLYFSCNANDNNYTVKSDLDSDVGKALGSAMMSEFGASGIPNMFVFGGDQDADFFPSQGSVNSKHNAVSIQVCNVGISSEAYISGDKINVAAKLKFFNDLNENLYLSIYVLEDGLENDQLTNSSTELKTHNNVVMGAANQLLLRGDLIGSSFTTSDEIERSFSIDLDPEWNTKNLDVVAVVWRGTGFAAQNGHISKVK